MIKLQITYNNQTRSRLGKHLLMFKVDRQQQRLTIIGFGPGRELLTFSNGATAEVSK